MDEMDYAVGLLSEWPWLHLPGYGLSSFDPHGPRRAA
jgi:hypothetical protein